MKRKMISVVAMMMVVTLALGSCGGNNTSRTNSKSQGVSGIQSESAAGVAATDVETEAGSVNLKLEEIQWTEFPALPADSNFPDKKVGYVYGELDALIEAYLESSDTFDYLPRSLEQEGSASSTFIEVLDQMENRTLTYQFLCENDADWMPVYILAVDSVTLKGAVYPNGGWTGDRATGHKSSLPDGARLSYVGKEVEEFDLKTLFSDYESRIVSNTYTEEDFMKAASGLIVPLVADAQSSSQYNARFYATASGTLHISPSGNVFQRSISVDLPLDARIGVEADMYTGIGSASYNYPGEGDGWKSGGFYLFLDSGLILERVEAERIDKNITEYDIPDGVTDIPSSTFAQCALERIGIPDTVVTIGSDAFYSLKSLKEVSLPENVIAIKQSAFGGCNALERIRVSQKTLDILNYSPEEFKKYIGYTNDDLVVEVY